MRLSPPAAQSHPQNGWFSSAHPWLVLTARRQARDYERLDNTFAAYYWLAFAILTLGNLFDKTGYFIYTS